MKMSEQEIKSAANVQHQSQSSTNCNKRSCRNRQHPVSWKNNLRISAKVSYRDY